LTKDIYASQIIISDFRKTAVLKLQEIYNPIIYSGEEVL